MPKAGKDAIKLIESLVRPFLRIGLNYNSMHNEDAYFYQLVYMAMKQYSAEGSGKVLGMKFDVPSPDRMLKVFRYSAKTLDAVRDGMLYGVTRAAKHYGAFKAPTDIAIDFFDIPYYGDIINECCWHEAKSWH